MALRMWEVAELFLPKGWWCGWWMGDSRVSFFIALGHTQIEEFEK